MKKMKLMFMDVAEDAEGRYWFFDNKRHFVGYMYNDFERVYPVRKLQKDLNMDKFISRHVYVNGNKIFISALNATRVIVYDVVADCFENYQGKDFQEGGSYNVVRCENLIVFIPYNLSEATYLFDISTCSWSECMWFAEDDMSLGTAEYVFEKDHYVYLPIVDTACILKLDLRTFSYEQIWVREDIRLNSVLVEEQGIWVTQRNSSVIVYCGSVGCEYFKCEPEQEDVQKAFASLVRVGNKIVALSRMVDYVAMVDIRERTIEKIDTSIPFSETKKMALFAGYSVQDSRIILFPWRETCSYILDCDKEKIDRKEHKMDYKDYYTFVVQRNIYENEEWALRDYMNIIMEL